MDFNPGPPRGMPTQNPKQQIPMTHQKLTPQNIQGNMTSPIPVNSNQQNFQQGGSTAMPQNLQERMASSRPPNSVSQQIFHQGGMTSSGLVNSSHLDILQGVKVMPQNIPGRMTSSRIPGSVNQHGGRVMPQNTQGNMTSSGLVNSSQQNMPQHINGMMMSSRPPNSVNINPQNFPQGGRVMPQNTQGKMTSYLPVNSSQQKFQQGGKVMLQNIQGNMTSSGPTNSVNLSHQNSQQGGRVVTQNIQRNMTSSGLGNLSQQNFQQGGKVMPQNNQGNLTSFEPPNSVNFSQQQEGRVMPQNIQKNMTSSSPVNSSQQNLQQGNMTSSGPVYLSQQIFQQGGSWVMPQYTQGNMTSSSPVNSSQPNFQQGTVMPQTQNTQGNMTSSSGSVNSSPQNLQQGGKAMPQNTQGNMTSSPGSINSSPQNFQQGGTQGFMTSSGPVILIQQGRVMPQNTQECVTSSCLNLSQQNFRQGNTQGNMTSSGPVNPSQQNLPQQNQILSSPQSCIQQPSAYQVSHYQQQPGMMANLQPQNVMKRNQADLQPVLQQNKRPRFEQPGINSLSGQQHNVSGIHQQKPEINGEADSVDFQEKVYQKILSMREKYLPELDEWLVKFSYYMQKQPTENQRQQEQRRLYKKKLETLVRLLKMNKSDVKIGYLGNLDKAEKHIIHEIEKSRQFVSSAALAPKPRLPQPAQVVVKLDDEDSQPQIPQTPIFVEHQPVNLEAQARHGAAQDMSASTSCAVSSPESQPPQTPIFVGADNGDHDTNASTSVVISSPHPQLAQAPDADVDRTQNLQTAENVVEDPFSKLSPIERLMKAVKSMPHENLRAAVSDIAAVVRMVDSVPGLDPDQDGCRGAVGAEFFGTTFSGSNKMRRFFM